MCVWGRNYEAIFVWTIVGDCGIHCPPMETCHVDEYFVRGPQISYGPLQLGLRHDPASNGPDMIRPGPETKSAVKSATQRILSLTVLGGEEKHLKNGGNSIIKCIYLSIIIIEKGTLNTRSRKLTRKIRSRLIVQFLISQLGL